ncbi:MAG: TIGR01212 family radical SAM protein [Oscillospiraceae bacterium]|nr:TIGR01212 family radical SAM protein [Oscillospiraceae bacterium]
MNNPFPYSDTNKRFHTIDWEYKRRFGKKVVKIPLNAGLGCPNRDGRSGVGGCTFCSHSLSGEFAGNPADSLKRQFEEVKKLYLNKWQSFDCIAYLQAGTNTYAPLFKLKEIYKAALELPVVGLSIATRADCIDTERLTFLKEVSQSTFLTVELGLQTVNDKTAERINRCHSFNDFVKGYDLLKNAGIRVGVHIINGLPGESCDDMLETARAVARLRSDELKIHLLHVISGTKIAHEYEKGELKTLEKEEYINLVCDQLEVLPPETAIGRLTGDGDRKTLLAPLWSMDKRSVLNGIDKELAKRNTYQGSKYLM